MIPMNSMPMYIAKPKPAAVAITADIFPIRPSHGFERTTSPIIHVMILFVGERCVSNLTDLVTGTKGLPYLKSVINTNVELKYGTTLFVFFSNS